MSHSKVWRPICQRLLLYNKNFFYDILFSNISCLKLYNKVMTSKTDNYYKDMAPVNFFSDIFNSKYLQKVPEDWYVVITDVMDSTKAIEQGRYKDVNIAGGMAAIAICNAFNDMDFPFIFGGDGITFLIPENTHKLVRDILYSTKLKVKELFDLGLRTGIVPVRDLIAQGHDLTIAKLKISEYYNQAIISGSGIEHAEYLIKQKITRNPYLIYGTSDLSVVADFTGFTCRWRDIHSNKGETISTIIKIRKESNIDEETLFSEIAGKIHDIFGDVSEYHPLTKETLHPANTKEYLVKEAKVTSGKRKGLLFNLKLLRVYFELSATKLAMKYNLKIKSLWYELNNLKQYEILSADFRKFDGMLKMILRCTPESRQKWQDYLEELYINNKIFYGVHISDRALMTCILHTGSKREVHFIDGADGGYALAAKQLKQQMKNI
jgi:hypothetical protein